MYNKSCNYANILSEEQLEEKYPTKRCKDCKERKPRADFYENDGSKDKLSSYCRKCASIRGSLRRSENIERYMYNQIKWRANDKKIEFNLDIEDIVLPEICPVFGVPLKVNKGIKDDSYSVDRIDNSKGYIKGNIIIVCNRVNRLKADASIEEIVKLAEFYKKLYESLHLS